jgi:hypothetical protein
MAAVRAFIAVDTATLPPAVDVTATAVR